MRSARAWGAAALLIGAVAGCDRGPPAPPIDEGPAAVTSATPATTAPKPSRCAEERAELATLPKLPGAPTFEQNRAAIFARAKGEPVLFLDEPKEQPPRGVELQILRKRLAAGTPVNTLPGVLKALRGRPDDVRALLLRDGYLYTDRPELASLEVDVLSVGKLFREREVWLQRGSRVHRLTRVDPKEPYRFENGDEATLLFGDRLAKTAEELAHPLHRDLSPVMAEAAPERIRIEALTEKGVLASLRYGATWTPAVLTDDGKSLHFGCADLDVASAKVRDENLEERVALDKLREAAVAMVGEKLRFDEPLEEVGQQDGSLRPLWKWAYDHGWDGYRFNDIGYGVFDAAGRPFPPQVCVDFVLDSYERASGGWYGGRADRVHTVGTIDFDAMGLDNRRSAARVAEFAEAHPEAFHVWNLSPEERIRFGDRAGFFGFLEAHEDDFRPGTIVIIHGMKADGKAHYHSFFVHDVDPITGFPYRLAQNAGRPRLSTWEMALRSAPARSIKHVIAPNPAWLVAMLNRDGSRIAKSTP